MFYQEYHASQALLWGTCVPNFGCKRSSLTADKWDRSLIIDEKGKEGIGSYLLYTTRKASRDIAILKALGLGSVSNNLSLSLGYFCTVIASLPIGLMTGFLLSQILVPRFNNLSVQDASPYYSLSIDLSVLMIFCSVIAASVIMFFFAVRITQNRRSIANIIRSDSEV